MIGLDVTFTASTINKDNCICDCCHGTGRVIQVQIPDTKYFNGRSLSTKYSGLWICKTCADKLVEALRGGGAGG